MSCSRTGTSICSRSGRSRAPTAPTPPRQAASPLRWIANQPYILLSITALCWAGNAIVGKIAPGTKVTISRGAMGSYFASIPGRPGFKVERRN